MNAKDEFLQHVKNNEVLCAHISINNDIFNLLTGYTNNEYLIFLSNINFEYDDCYGSQYLFGCIWYTNGSWSIRSEYDGSEWWEYCILPEIPNFLDKNKIRSEKIDSIV